VDLCCYGLPELDRLSGTADLQTLVEHLLERHYANGCGPVSTDDAAFERDRCRRDQILHVLGGHPVPFDKTATVRLMGRLVADRILDLQATPWFDLGGQWGRVVRKYRLSRFRSQVRLWPCQFRAAFSLECLTPDEDRQRVRAESSGQFSTAESGSRPLLTEPQVEAARRRLQFRENVLGVLIADALLSDISRHERVRRRRLRSTNTAVAHARRAK
jgi:hypothetical protein